MQQLGNNKIFRCGQIITLNICPQCGRKHLTDGYLCPVCVQDNDFFREKEKFRKKNQAKPVTSPTKRQKIIEVLSQQTYPMTMDEVAGALNIKGTYKYTYQQIRRYRLLGLTRDVNTRQIRALDAVYVFKGAKYEPDRLLKTDLLAVISRFPDNAKFPMMHGEVILHTTKLELTALLKYGLLARIKDKKGYKATEKFFLLKAGKDVTLD